MEKILLYSEIAAVYRNPADRLDKVTVPKQSFTYVPAWVKESDMYKSLAADNLARISESKAEQKKLENDGLKEQAKATKAAKTKTEKTDTTKKDSEKAE